MPDPAELPAALERALASDRPSCVNVMTDPSVIAPVTVAMLGMSGGGADGGSSQESVTIPYYDNLDAKK